MVGRDAARQIADELQVQAYDFLQEQADHFVTADDADALHHGFTVGLNRGISE